MLLSSAAGASRATTRVPPEFQAVILCGYGQQLFPLLETIPKPLLPVGNEPVLGYTLRWVEESGIRDILVLSPTSSSSQISPYIRNFSSASLPILGAPAGAANHKESDLRIEYETVDDEECVGWDTADWVRKAKEWIKTDFVLLPCDILPPPSLPLSRILDAHRLTSSSTLITSLFYEKTDLGGREGPPAHLTVYDARSSTLLQAGELGDVPDTLELRSSLVWKFPKITLTSALLDAHAYVVRKPVLDLLSARPEIASFREDLVPWLCKWAWQKGMWDRWGGALNLPPDPFELALAHSTTNTDPPPMGGAFPDLSASTTTTVGAPSHPASTHPSAPPSPTTRRNAENPYAPLGPRRDVRVALLVHRAQDGFFARANTLGGYAEMNREILRAQRPAVSAQAPGGRAPAPDSLIGAGTKLGEKVLVKKSVIGRNVVLGKGARVIGCVIADDAVICDGAKLDNCIVCRGARVGDRAALTLCEVGGGAQIIADTQAKSEKLTREN